MDSSAAAPQRSNPRVQTFAAVYEAYAWRPMPHCPGRFLRAHPRVDRTLDAWLTAHPRARRHVTPRAPDPVWVLPLDGGGLVSYEKPDGTFLHTLGDADGFERKLDTLGLSR
jgi:hypothetical protein